MSFDKLIEGIKKARQVVEELIPLVMGIGTLIAVIHMIMHSIR